MKVSEILRETTILFVLNGLLNGEEGVRATRTVAWEPLADGWYFLRPGEEEPSSGPYDNRKDAVEAAQELQCVLDLRTSEVLMDASGEPASWGEVAEDYSADVLITPLHNLGNSLSGRGGTWRVTCVNYYGSGHSFILEASQDVDRAVRAFCAALLEDTRCEQDLPYRPSEAAGQSDEAEGEVADLPKYVWPLGMRFRRMEGADYDGFAGAEPGSYIRSTEKGILIYHPETGEVEELPHDPDTAEFQQRTWKRDFDLDF